MTTAGLALLFLTVAAVTWQLCLVACHISRLASVPPRPQTTNWPATAIVIAVRGGNEGLEECLDRVAALNYEDFELHVVIDHETDPCMPLVRRWAATQPRLAVVIHTLANPSSGATLKCSAMYQALTSLSNRIEAVVMLDADAYVYPNWLKDMLQPTLDGTVSMATGNRWYSPTAPGLGSLLRFLYNANAVIPMHAGRMTWGGSLALRRDVFTHPAFLESLLCSPTEDASVHEAISVLGKRLAMVSHVMLLTTDPIDVAACVRFIQRQLLWTRLYHAAWPLIAFGSAAAYAVALVACVALVWSTIRGHWPSAVAFGSALAVAIAGNLVAVEILHRGIAAVIGKRQGRKVPSMDTLCRLRVLAAIPLSLPVIAFTAVSAALARRVRWSGIEYEIDPPRRIRLVEYRPVNLPLASSS
ncbi:MAG: glycosyltransferase [Planctomycetia bacterium]